MKTKKEVGLEDLGESLYHAHVKIDQEFLWKLMQRASNSEKPHCDKEFVKKLGLRFSSKYSCNTVYG